MGVSTVALIIAVHWVNEIIRAVELSARATRSIFRATVRRITHRVRPTRRGTVGEPTPS